MNRKQDSNIQDALNLIVSGAMSLFSILFGSSLLIGLASEPEKSETFLVVLGWGLLFGGLGCAIYCFYLLTHKVFQWMYYLALASTIAGYSLAIIGQAIYKLLAIRPSIPAISFFTASERNRNCSKNNQ